MWYRLERNEPRSDLRGLYWYKLGSALSTSLKTSAVLQQAKMQARPHRLLHSLSLGVPVSDHRTHPETHHGSLSEIGNGILYHDFVNVPFYRRCYHSMVDIYPLSVKDRIQDQGMRPRHLTFLIKLLWDIQEQSRENRGARVSELDARQKSIWVLFKIRKDGIKNDALLVQPG